MDKQLVTNRRESKMAFSDSRLRPFRPVLRSRTSLPLSGTVPAGRVISVPDPKMTAEDIALDWEQLLSRAGVAPHEAGH